MASLGVVGTPFSEVRWDTLLNMAKLLDITHARDWRAVAFYTGWSNRDIQYMPNVRHGKLSDAMMFFEIYSIMPDSSVEQFISILHHIGRNDVLGILLGQFTDISLGSVISTWPAPQDCPPTIPDVWSLYWEHCNKMRKVQKLDHTPVVDGPSYVEMDCYPYSETNSYDSYQNDSPLDSGIYSPGEVHPVRKESVISFAKSSRPDRPASHSYEETEQEAQVILSQSAPSEHCLQTTPPCPPRHSVSLPDDMKIPEVVPDPKTVIVLTYARMSDKRSDGSRSGSTEGKQYLKAFENEFKHLCQMDACVVYAEVPSKTVNQNILDRTLEKADFILLFMSQFYKEVVKEKQSRLVSDKDYADHANTRYLYQRIHASVLRAPDTRQRFIPVVLRDADQLFVDSWLSAANMIYKLPRHREDLHFRLRKPLQTMRKFAKQYMQVMQPR